MSDNGISWAICKSAPHSRLTTMPARHHSDALPAAQWTASKHWRQLRNCHLMHTNLHTQATDRMKKIQKIQLFQRQPLAIFTSHATAQHVRYVGKGNVHASISHLYVLGWQFWDCSSFCSAISLSQMMLSIGWFARLNPATCASSCGCAISRECSCSGPYTCLAHNSLPAFNSIEFHSTFAFISCTYAIQPADQIWDAGSWRGMGRWHVEPRRRHKKNNFFKILGHLFKKQRKSCGKFWEKTYFMLKVQHNWSLDCLWWCKLQALRPWQLLTTLTQKSLQCSTACYLFIYLFFAQNKRTVKFQHKDDGNWCQRQTKSPSYTVIKTGWVHAACVQCSDTDG